MPFENTAAVASKCDQSTSIGGTMATDLPSSFDQAFADSFNFLLNAKSLIFSGETEKFMNECVKTAWKIVSARLKSHLPVES